MFKSRQENVRCIAEHYDTQGYRELDKINLESDFGPWPRWSAAKAIYEYDDVDSDMGNHTPEW